MLVAQCLQLSYTKKTNLGLVQISPQAKPKEKVKTAIGGPKKFGFRLVF